MQGLDQPYKGWDLESPKRRSACDMLLQLDEAEFNSLLQILHARLDGPPGYVCLPRRFLLCEV